ncbi:MAG TPA: type 2 isopentenyl-diphosphate Delta-isomerase [Clostridia bacterium]
MAARESRKIDHLNLAMIASHDGTKTCFGDINLIHYSLPGSSYDECKLEVELGNVKLRSPIIINAMTGGEETTGSINRDLAIVARETGLCMAVGSQRAAISNTNLAFTYKVVRDTNPDGVIVGNLGADCSIDEARAAVEMIGADMLQLHLNVPQEMVMPEGDRNFINILENIAYIVENLKTPVIAKETGFGMCRETFEKLKSTGIKIVDISGRGGTNFIWIENKRRNHCEYDTLVDWGQPTAISLLESIEYQDVMQIISSGGIMNCMDMAKSFHLGASAVGIAIPLLRKLKENGVKGCIETVDLWHEQIKAIMTMVGVSRISEFSSLPVVITGKAKEWCETRGIDLSKLAKRTGKV